MTGQHGQQQFTKADMVLFRPDQLDKVAADGIGGAQDMPFRTHARCLHFELLAQTHPPTASRRQEDHIHCGWV